MLLFDKLCMFVFNELTLKRNYVDFVLNIISIVSKMTLDLL